MANITAKTSSNVFYQARCKASKHNEQLSSREGAADIMSIDRGRIYRIENGVANPYPEEVHLMADLYNAPELRNYYCTEMCPLGCEMPKAEIADIGVVTEVYEAVGNFVVVEGNYSNSVKKRTVSINGRYIRGFIAPKYDTYDVTTGAPQVSGKDIKTIAREVIAGAWGNGTARKQALVKAGYSYSEVQKAVNQILNGGAIEQTKPVAQTIKSLTASDAAQKLNKTFAGAYKTTADLYLRHGAGTNKKAMVVIDSTTSEERRECL